MKFCRSLVSVSTHYFTSQVGVVIQFHFAKNMLLLRLKLFLNNTAYIPMVGKVTVAMLERNLMRLFYNFHHPDRAFEDKYKSAFEAQRPAPWYGNLVQVYTALAATAILAMLVSKSK